MAAFVTSQIRFGHEQSALLSKPQTFAAMVVKFSQNTRLECSVETGRLVTGDVRVGLFLSYL